METLFTGLIFAFLFTYILIPPLLKIAEVKKLYDLPDERKKHLKPTPALGGISFFIAFWLSIMILANTELLLELRYLFVCSFLLLIVGIQDDLQGIRPLKKFLSQVLVGSVLFFAGFQMEGLYGVFGIYELPEVLSYILTVLVFAFIINAFNLIDGINGLAASLGLVGSVGYGILFWQNGLMDWALISVLTIGFLLAFLRFNFGKADIFMGDCGSMFVGLIMSIFFVKYLNSEPLPHNTSPLLVALSLIIIPLIDLVRVFGFRILNGRSPFLPDRNHLHHHLQRMGKSHPWIVGIIIGLNLLIISYLYNYPSEEIILKPLLLIMFFFLLFIALAKFSSSLTEIKKTEIKRHMTNFSE